MRRNQSPSLPSPKARRGSSLVELLITISLGGVVMGLGLGTLHLLLRTDKTLAESLWRSQTVSNLSQTFRRDVHAARAVKIEQPENAPNANEPAPPELVIEQSDGRLVRYSVQDDSLLRTETEGKETRHTERFRFLPGTEVSFETGMASKVSLVIRSINPLPVKANQPHHTIPMRELRIEASVGRDERFHGTKPQQEQPAE